MTAVWGIVLAGGSGLRFGAAKQFATLGDRRLVDHAVAAAAATCDGVVVVLPPGVRWDGEPVNAAAEGGPTRAASVRAGLAAVGERAEIVVLTDAAHPVATPELFDRVAAAVRAGAPAAIPGIEPVDVVKEVSDRRVVATVPRERCVITQMPQAFRTDVLRRAHAEIPDAVEDSAMVEALGLAVTVVAGDAANIHVTDPLTLAFAEVVHRMAQE